MSIDCPVFSYTISLLLPLLMHSVDMVCAKDSEHGLAACMALRHFPQQRIQPQRGKKGCFQEKNKNVCIAGIM
jgi:hypothetical protein